MLRVVVDLNVVVSGLIQPAGAPRAVLRAALSRRIALAVCPRWAEEVRAVTGRAHFRSRFTVEEAATLIDGLLEVGEAHPDPPLVPAVTPDRDDDYLIALALAAACDAIVTCALRASSRC